MRILAVDDDPIILELLKQFIEAFGEHELTVAESGSEALDLINGSEAAVFDCFLLDIQMPLMDGITLTREIRLLEAYSDAPVLMLTTMSDKRYIDAAFTAGATDYITKPFEVSELRARLALVEALVQARRANTQKVAIDQTAPTDQKSPQICEELELHEPISIYDVDNVIEYVAMENYVTRLSRSSLFGSTAFAFSIRQIEKFHDALSAFEFNCLVTDVAEVISDSLASKQFLMSYAGHGTFVCVTESGWRPETQKLMDSINLALSRIELYNNSGERLHPRVSAGDPLRLIWKSGSSALEALASAHTSAEYASVAHERRMNDFWLPEKSA